MPRILLAHNFYRSTAPSGEDQAFIAEREMLENAGFEVVSYERRSDEIDNYGTVEMLDAALAATWSDRTYKEIKSILATAKPDLAHFHNIFPLISPSAYTACNEQNIPVVQTLHNYRLICPGALLLRNDRPCEQCVGRTLWPALRYRCYRQSIGATTSVVLMLAYNRWRGSFNQKVDRFIALTEFAAGRFVAGGLPCDKIAVRGNYLPNSLVPKNILKKENHAVYVGRLSAEKGIKTLISAWRRVHCLPLKVIGDGPLRDELEDFVKRQGLDIRFLGKMERKEVIDIVSRAVFQIIPSLCYEGFPLAVAEAYACGTPVIASRIGSLVELIEPNRTGLFFEPGNEQDISDKIEQSMCWVKQQNWGEHARETFNEKYSETKSFDKLIEIYLDVLVNKCTAKNSVSEREVIKKWRQFLNI